LLADHHETIRDSLKSYDGREVGTHGDSFFATFTSPTAGVAAALEMQHLLAGHTWPGEERPRVRRSEMRTSPNWLTAWT
jgi:class 3 adenylate cyclase